MIWAVRALQSGRAQFAKRYLRFPEEVAKATIGTPHFVYPWLLETLVNEGLTSSASIGTDQQRRRLNCGEFSAFRAVYSALHELEDADDRSTLDRVDVISEMHRLTQRQFEWQRGFLSFTQLYRAARVFRGEKTLGYFERRIGVSFDDFSLGCFGLVTLWAEKPTLSRDVSLMEIGLSASTTSKIVDALSIPLSEARELTSRLRAGQGHVAYKRSLLRQYPCIAFGTQRQRIHAPLPELVTLRSTSGVYYDVVSGGDDVRNEIGRNFERYCLEWLSETLSSRQVCTSFRYQVRKQNMDAPDILVSASGEIEVIVECKASRLTYEARYSEQPLVDAERGYAELAKGVFRFGALSRICGDNSSPAGMATQLSLDWFALWTLGYPCQLSFSGAL